MLNHSADNTPKNKQIILTPTEEGCPLIIGTAVKEPTLSLAASVGLTALFHPTELEPSYFSDLKERRERLKCTSDSEWKKIPPVEKIDYGTRKQRLFTQRVLALEGLEVTRKKPGEYGFNSSEIDHSSSSNYSA